MLSPQDNELLTRVGPGTAMGALLRRFWIPALLETEIAEPDGPPVRLRLLGEDLVAFRDTEGRIGVLDAHCPHRRAHLFFGRNEECGLRCVYHGWKFDVEGRCVDMPSEPPETDFKHKVRTTAYPAEEAGGVVWVYMGPPDRRPELPAFEWTRLAADRRTAIKRLQECNWAQAVEGGIDSAHISFLHSEKGGPGRGNFNRRRDDYALSDRAPVFDVVDTPYGLQIGARRGAGAGAYYWRITQFLVPFWQMIPPALDGEDPASVPYGGHAWVPVDDETTWTWSFSVHPRRAFTPEERALSGGRGGTWGPVDAAYRPLLNKRNDYGLDREAQRTRSFTGISGVGNQDVAVQESMGPVTDRSREHLGSSDVAVIAWRRKMLALARDLATGKEPAMAAHGAWYNVRSASVVLPADAPWAEASAPLTAGLPLAEEAARG